MTQDGMIWSIHLHLLLLLHLHICKVDILTVNEDMMNKWTRSTRCSWHSSGGTDRNIIQKVNLSCSSGHLQWNNPAGGVHVRLLMRDRNEGRICLRIRFIPSHKVSYRLQDGSDRRLLNIDEEFQKCMDVQTDILIYIEAYNVQTWKQRVAGFRYEILPESWIADEKPSCAVCSSTDIIDAFCNNADFVFEGHQNNRNDYILVDKILRRPLHHHQIVERRINGSILKAPVSGCLHKNDEISRIYIARMEFDMVRVICSPTISHYVHLAREQFLNAPCQLL